MVDGGSKSLDLKTLLWVDFVERLDDFVLVVLNAPLYMFVWLLL